MTDRTQWVYVAEITVAIDDAGTLETHYVCSGEGFATRPTDTPPNTPIPPTLMDAGSLRREMFSGDRPFGIVRSAYGEVSLYNGNGQYDSWEHHGFDGRDFVLRWGPIDGAYPSDFHTIFVCTIEGITLTETDARLRLRDNTQLLDKSFLNKSFLGGTVQEGGEIQKGQAKYRYINSPRWTGPMPQTIGTGWGNTLYLLTTGRASSSRVWDNGNELTQGTLTSAQFWNLTSTVTPGYYYLLFENGSTYLRLASRPEGDIRVFTRTTQDSGDDWSMQTFLQESGYIGPVVGTALPDLNVVVADSNITYSKIFDDAAANAGMWYGFDRLGRFVSNTFDEPAGTPVLNLSRSNCVSIKRSPVQGMEIPLYQLTVNSIQTWKSQYTAPTNYVRYKFEAEQWINRYSYSDESRLLKHPSARSLSMDLLIGPDSPSDWDAFRERYMRLFGVDRSCITAMVHLSPEMLGVDIGDTVRVQWPRFNLNEGRLFRVIALRYSLKSQQLELVLWG